MSLMPNTPYSSVGANGTPIPYELPHGVTSNLTWLTQSGLSGALTASMPAQGVQVNDVVCCTLQPLLRNNQNVTDCINCWLICATPGTNTINVYIANGGGGTNGAPVDNANFAISWSVQGKK